MGYKLGVGLLLFGILLTNVPESDLLFWGGLIFGVIGLFLVIGSCLHENYVRGFYRTYEQNAQNNAANDTSGDNASLNPPKP